MRNTTNVRVCIINQFGDNAAWIAYTAWLWQECKPGHVTSVKLSNNYMKHKLVQTASGSDNVYSCSVAVVVHTNNRLILLEDLLGLFVLSVYF